MFDMKDMLQFDNSAQNSLTCLSRVDQAFFAHIPYDKAIVVG